MVGVGIERVEEGCLSVFSSEYLKKKKRFLKGRSIFILLGLFFLSGKLPNRIYYPVSSSHAESKDRRDKNLDLILHRFIGLLCLPSYQ